jgi:GT2 family glycosyltransferase
LRKEIEQLKRETTRGSSEQERGRNDLLSQREPSVDLIATEREAPKPAPVHRVGSGQHLLHLALANANSESPPENGQLRSPLRNAYRLIRASERFIRRRLRKSGTEVPDTAGAPSDRTVKARFKKTAYDEQLIDRSGLLDPEWYRSQLPEATTSSLSHHYLTQGAAKGLDPNPLFDTSWYLEQYDDVRDSEANPLVHYLRHGAAEGRDPNPFFDGDWYLEQNQDVKKGGSNPLSHYLLHGAREGREPSERFHSHWYKKEYLGEESAGINALAHYLHYGRAAGYNSRSPNYAYRLEVLKQDQTLSTSTSEIEEHVKAMTIRPRFLILIEGAGTTLQKETEKSLQNQLYSDWLLIESLAAVIGGSAGTEDSPRFFIELAAGDCMHKLALYAFASVINADPMVDIVYTDDDRLDDSGARTRPFFKPDWSPDYLESMNYIGPSVCFRWNLAHSFLEQGARGYDLTLRLTEVAKNISHVRQPLFHRKDDESSCSPEDSTRDIEALKGRLRRTNRAGEIEPIIPRARCYDCKINLSSSPLVSVIIPTAGKRIKQGKRSLDLLANCLETIQSRSTYKNLEFIVVDNGDLSSVQRDCLKYYGAKSITFREPKFNVAKKLNLGASIATGSLFLLLNDDVEPLSSDWIERLVEHFEKPHVGVVGAKLLYSDETLQHVGVVLNGCNPDHVRRSWRRNDLGYYFSTAAARNFTAVTGACMMTRASSYKSVGGYTESLAISFNDVDFCLKTIESGLTVVYAPRAELIHYESQSRVPELDMDELEFFYRRWTCIVSDRFYNESELSVAPPTFEVKHNPRAF